MNIRGTAVLVTGGSRGLGAELGRAFAREGARVVLVGRDGTALDRVVDGIRGQGGESWSVAADVSSKEAIHAIAGAAAALAGPIDVLVHNAGTLGPTPLRSLLDTDCEDVERALAVNVLGPFRLSKVIAGSMVLRGRGLIAHVTSDAAVEAYPTWGAYGLSKAALEHMARTWSVELAGTGVRSIAIDPGEMNTKMHADALPDADPATLSDPREIARRIVRLFLTLDARTGERFSLSQPEVPS
jgi:NAD(P)-dependent dehydrogenase (short-subunit alcohol dehydrogenase family)